METLEQELISVIYETVLDEGFWPDIINGLAKEIENFDRSPDRFPAAAMTHLSGEAYRETALIQCLIPFFKQAFELNRHYTTVLAKNEALESLLENIPIGVLLIDNDFNILSFNNRARDILDQRHGMFDNHGRLGFTNMRSAALLQQHLTHTQTDVQKFLLSDSENQSMLSILVAVQEPKDPECRKRIYSIFIMCADTDLKISPRALYAEYKITPAEANLINGLIGGKSISEYAQQTGISENTLRYQLRTIFRKTGTGKLPQLFKRLLTSPSYFFQLKHNPHPPKRRHLPNLSDDDYSLTLSDGRRLCYSLDGDRHGEPVIFLHGKYGSRLLQHPDRNIAKDIGVQVITLDRSGYGRSDPHPNLSFIQWSDDLRQLLDARDIDQCAIIGLETGAAYACACAYKLPERIRKIILCNAYAPNMRLSDFSGTIPMERLFYTLARYTPSLFRNFTELRIKGMLHELDWYYEKIRQYLQGSDRALLDRREYLEMLHRNGVESLKEPKGFINDMINVTRPWGVPMGEIEAEVEIWHGKQNQYIPSVMAERLAQALPRASTYMLAHQGHFLALPYWSVLLASAKVNKDANFLCWL